MDYVCSQWWCMEISEAEYEVMEAIWDGHPCTASDIAKRLASRKEWHIKTVKTLLGRLVKKGAIGFEQQQRHYLYHPLLEKSAYQQTQSRSLLDRLFGGKVSPLVASFASQKPLQQEDIDELKKLIAQWESKDD